MLCIYIYVPYYCSMHIYIYIYLYYVILYYMLCYIFNMYTHKSTHSTPHTFFGLLLTFQRPSPSAAGLYTKLCCSQDAAATVPGTTHGKSWGKLTGENQGMGRNSNGKTWENHEEYHWLSWEYHLISGCWFGT